MYVYECHVCMFTRACGGGERECACTRAVVSVVVCVFTYREFGLGVPQQHVGGCHDVMHAGGRPLVAVNLRNGGLLQLLLVLIQLL